MNIQPIIQAIVIYLTLNAGFYFGVLLRDFRLKTIALYLTMFLVLIGLATLIYGKGQVYDSQVSVYEQAITTAYQLFGAVVGYYTTKALFAKRTTCMEWAIKSIEKTIQIQ